MMFQRHSLVASDKLPILTVKCKKQGFDREVSWLLNLASHMLVLFGVRVKIDLVDLHIESNHPAFHIEVQAAKNISTH